MQVGTERDIPGAASVGLAVVVDTDSMLLRPHYRAEEDTLRILARVAATVRRGRGHRCVIQTRMPDHRVLEAMRHGTGAEIIPEWQTRRATLSSCHHSANCWRSNSLMRHLLWTARSGHWQVPKLPCSDLEKWGPYPLAYTGPGSPSVEDPLRPQVQNWRDRRIKVRVDADPLDV